MKITDYGLWFKNNATGLFTIKPVAQDFDVFLSGIWVGFTTRDFITVSVSHLNRIGFRVNPDSPGDSDYDLWSFPDFYIPAESDFQELP